jgi:uncharacterized membrane protein YoaK (UPF0700 family)
VATQNGSVMAPAEKGQTTQLLQEGNRDGPLSLPSIEDSYAIAWLPFVLSVIAGSVDIIGFLALASLFTSHITGNLVVLAARVVTHEQATLAAVIAVPVFMVALILTRLLVAALERAGIASRSSLAE